MILVVLVGLRPLWIGEIPLNCCWVAPQVRRCLSLSCGIIISRGSLLKNTKQEAPPYESSGGETLSVGVSHGGTRRDFLQEQERSDFKCLEKVINFCVLYQIYCSAYPDLLSDK